jgi:hypothetical protein
VPVRQFARDDRGLRQTADVATFCHSGEHVSMALIILRFPKPAHASGFNLHFARRIEDYELR